MRANSIGPGIAVGAMNMLRSISRGMLGKGGGEKESSGSEKGSPQPPKISSVLGHQLDQTTKAQSRPEFVIIEEFFSLNPEESQGGGGGRANGEELGGEEGEGGGEGRGRGGEGATRRPLSVRSNAGGSDVDTEQLLPGLEGGEEGTSERSAGKESLLGANSVASFSGEEEEDFSGADDSYSDIPSLTLTMSAMLKDSGSEKVEDSPLLSHSPDLVVTNSGSSAGSSSPPGPISLVRSRSRPRVKSFGSDLLGSEQSETPYVFSNIPEVSPTVVGGFLLSFLNFSSVRANYPSPPSSSRR